MAERVLSASNGLRAWIDMHLTFLKEWRDIWVLLRRNPLSLLGLSLILLLVLTAIFAPLLAPFDPIHQELGDRLHPPGGKYLLGTDQLGRDIFSRIIYGSRISLKIAFIVAGVAGSIGLILGAISGYAGGVVDEVLMRITDMFLAFPRLILAMAIAAALGPNLTNTVVAISLVAWPVYARLARGETLAIRENDYIHAVRLLGASRTRILFRHILPLCLNPIIVQMTLDMGGIILIAAGLGFIGFGAQPPTPEWGVMVSDGRNFIVKEWWVSTFPGCAIFLTVLGFNLLGDGIRDILDPRQRH
ncbi:MAG: ABC transporter permease [Nitrospinota bacterium]|nr:MAG: ABC transporter permease [Nitrospinota bacterium]